MCVYSIYGFWHSRTMEIPFKISYGPVGQSDEIIGIFKAKHSNRTFGSPSYLDDRINRSNFDKYFN